LIAAALLAFFLVRGGTGTPTTGRVVRIEAATGKVARDVRVGNDPRAIAAGPGSVWVANFGDSTVSKLELATSRVETIAVNGPPLSLGVSEGVVLVASGPPANSLTLIRARGGSAYDIVPLLARPAGATSLVAAGPAGVWVVDKERWTVDRVSLRGGNDFRLVAGQRLRLRHPLAELNSAAVGKDAVWLAGNTVDRRIWRLDPRTARVVATVRLAIAPRRVAVGEGAVWVTGEIDNVVLRIDPRESRVVARVPIGRGGSGIAAGAGSVWVANELDGTITRIDPGTNHVVETIRVGGSPHDLVVAGGEVWVAKGQE
jgi:YVTN family beta-propeller protein